MSLREKLKPWGDAALGLLYPERCPGCEKYAPLAHPHALCAECEATTRRIVPPYCEVCSEPFSGEFSGAFKCSNCNGRKVAFEFAACAYESAGQIREMIHRFKYERQFHLREALGRLMAEALDEPRLAGINWTLTPVPLHRKRLREREFNQSLELARVAARLTGWQLIHGLRRSRYTTIQARLDRAQRLKNLRGAFGLRWLARLKHRFQGLNVLVVDDVFTTGATAHECAEVLKQQGGAARVAVLTLARG